MQGTHARESSPPPNNAMAGETISDRPRHPADRPAPAKRQGMDVRASFLNISHGCGSTVKRPDAASSKKTQIPLAKSTTVYETQQPAQVLRVCLGCADLAVVGWVKPTVAGLGNPVGFTHVRNRPQPYRTDSECDPRNRTARADRRVNAEVCRPKKGEPPREGDGLAPPDHSSATPRLRRNHTNPTRPRGTAGRNLRWRFWLSMGSVRDLCASNSTLRHP
jgi:hypothetical protein